MNLWQFFCFLPEFWYPPKPRTPAWSWEHDLDYFLKSKSLFFLFTSLSSSLYLQCFGHKFSWGFLEKYLSQKISPSLYPMLSFCIPIPHPNLNQCSRKTFSAGIDIPTGAICLKDFQLSDIHSDPLNTSCELWFTWLSNLIQRPNHFQPHSDVCSRKNLLPTAEQN